MGIGITNSFINYKHPWGRSFADLGCFGLGVGIGMALVATFNPVTLGGAILLGGATIGVAAITCLADNAIRSDLYYQERKWQIK